MDTERNTRLAMTAVGIAVTFLAFYLWLHEGFAIESAFFAVTIGPVLFGGVVPRASDDESTTTLKRIGTAMCVCGAIVMVFTMSVVPSLIAGVVLGLMVAGMYQFIDNINGKTAKDGVTEAEKPWPPPSPPSR